MFSSPSPLPPGRLSRRTPEKIVTLLQTSEKAKVMVVLSWQTKPTLWERGGERDFFYPSTPVCQHFSAGKHALKLKKTVHADKGG